MQNSTKRLNNILIETFNGFRILIILPSLYVAFMFMIPFAWNFTTVAGFLGHLILLITYGVTPFITVRTYSNAPYRIIVILCCLITFYRSFSFIPCDFEGTELLITQLLVYPPLFVFIILAAISPTKNQD